MSKEAKNAQALSIVALVTVLFNFGVDTLQASAINAQTKAINRHTETLEVLAKSNNQLVNKVFPDVKKTEVVIK